MITKFRTNLHNTWWWKIQNYDEKWNIVIRIILSCIIGTYNKAKEICCNNSFISLSLSGTVDWRLWAIASPALHLIIPLLCFILVRCGWWPSLHHRRIDSLSLRARTKINQVVEESWEELLLCAKDLMDTRLEDGKEFFQTFCDRDLLYFSCQTRRYIFYTKMS